MHSRIGRSLIAAVMLVIAISSATNLASAVAHVKPASKPTLLNLEFKLVAHGWLVSTSGDRYVLVSTSIQAPSSPVVIDDATQQASTIPLPASSCTAFGLSATRVVFNCGSRWQSDVRAYSVTENAPQPMPQFNSGCEQGDPTCGAEPVAVGADWIEYQTTPCYHCGGSASNVFQNIDTGKVFMGRITARTIANLDRRQLTQRVCAPLQVPSGGSLVLAGGFALASSAASTLVERCGAKRPVMAISRGIPVSTAQRRAIIWQHGSSRTLRGIALPSLRRFFIALPGRIFVGAPSLGALCLTDRTLYVETVNQATQQPEIWAAPAKNL